MTHLPTPRCPSFQSIAQTYTANSRCNVHRICPALFIYRNLHTRSPRINSSFLPRFLFFIFIPTLAPLILVVALTVRIEVSILTRFRKRLVYLLFDFER
jgi:hypothetical protein